MSVAPGGSVRVVSSRQSASGERSLIDSPLRNFRSLWVVFVRFSCKVRSARGPTFAANSADDVTRGSLRNLRLEACEIDQEAE